MLLILESVGVLILQTAVMSLLKLIIGGTIYYMLEILARGYSHPSMFLLGGICFLLCGVINNELTGHTGMWEKMALCMITITILEFLTGLIVNGILHLNVWDYSRMPFHVLGQICLPYMILWFFLSYPALILNQIVDSWSY